jgi:polyhydroxyalkanoate synthase
VIRGSTTKAPWRAARAARLVSSPLEHPEITRRAARAAAPASTPAAARRAAPRAARASTPAAARRAAPRAARAGTRAWTTAPVPHVAPARTPAAARPAVMPALRTRARRWAAARSRLVTVTLGTTERSWPPPPAAQHATVDDTKPEVRQGPRARTVSSAGTRTRPVSPRVFLAEVVTAAPARA